MSPVTIPAPVITDAAKADLRSDRYVPDRRIMAGGPYQGFATTKPSEARKSRLAYWLPPSGKALPTGLQSCEKAPSAPRDDGKQVGIYPAHPGWYAIAPARQVGVSVPVPYVENGVTPLRLTYRLGSQMTSGQCPEIAVTPGGDLGGKGGLRRCLDAYE